MKRLFYSLSLVAVVALSSCLGRTAAPGLSAPQSEAPQETTTMVGKLDSLLRAGDGNGIFGTLSNAMEVAMEMGDAQKAGDYLRQIQDYLKGNADAIDAALADIDFADDARSLVASFRDRPIDEQLANMGYDIGLTEQDVR